VTQCTSPASFCDSRTPSRVQEVRAVRVGAMCRGSSWFPRAWMVPAPCFEVLKDPAAPRRGSLRARQTLAGRRKSELLRRWRPCWRPQRRVLAMDSRAERASFLRIFSRCDRFLELASQNSASTFTVTKKLCGVFEINKQPGWRMELNTTAVPLPIFCPTKGSYSGTYQRNSEV